MKKIIMLVAVLVAVCGLVACGKKEGESDGPVTIVKGDSETSKNQGGTKPYVGQDDLDPYVANIPNEIIDFYIEKINEIEKEHKEALKQRIEEDPDFDISTANNLKYDLVFIDDNNTPELVVDNPGYNISLYTYDAGKVMNAFGDEESWAYGAGGNGGYDYAPKKNVIYNVSNDMAGMIRYFSYYKLNDKHLVESIYADSLGELHFEDKDGDRLPGENDEYVDEPTKYFLGEKDLTQEEFEAKILDFDYEELAGTKSAEEILKLLNGLINVK